MEEMKKMRKGLWSPDEDEKLRHCIANYKNGTWSDIARMSGLVRCGKDCRRRWINHLWPTLNKKRFTSIEINQVVELQKVVGNRWAKIAKHLVGRTDKDVKNLWNTHIRNKRIKDMNMQLGHAEVKDNDNKIDSHHHGSLRKVPSIEIDSHHHGSSRKVPSMEIDSHHHVSLREVPVLAIDRHHDGSLMEVPIMEIDSHSWSHGSCLDKILIECVDSEKTNIFIDNSTISTHLSSLFHSISQWKSTPTFVLLEESNLPTHAAKNGENVTGTWISSYVDSYVDSSYVDSYVGVNKDLESSNAGIMLGTLEDNSSWWSTLEVPHVELPNHEC